MTFFIHIYLLYFFHFGFPFSRILICLIFSFFCFFLIVPPPNVILFETHFEYYHIFYCGTEEVVLISVGIRNDQLVCFLNPDQICNGSIILNNKWSTSDPTPCTLDARAKPCQWEKKNNRNLEILWKMNKFRSSTSNWHEVCVVMWQILFIWNKVI